MAAGPRDAGQADVQKQVDEEQEKGYHGVKVDPEPNSAYSLQSGPTSPPAVPDDTTRVGQTHVTSKEKPNA